MKLTTLTISGFQCFGERPAEISLDDVSYLLGPNSSGKTAVLHALARMFAVDPALRGVRPSDFHVRRPGPARSTPDATVGDQEAGGASSANGGSDIQAGEVSAAVDQATGSALTELWIEAEFTLPEVGASESTGAPPAIPEFLFQMRLEAIDAPMRVRIRLTATLDSADEVDERLEFVLSRDAAGNPTKVQPVGGYARRRIQLHYLPARRNPREQISYAPGSLLGNALRAANWQSENRKIQAWNSEITQALSENPAILAIGTHLTKNWSQLHRSDHYAAPTIGFGQNDLDLLLRQLTVNFGPNPQGATSNFDMLSDGQQSLLYLTTVLALHEVGRALLTQESGPFSEEKYRPAVFTMLAFEEPENSLSPFYLGRVLKLLKTSAGEPDCQAVIATHSPAVVRRVLPAQIRYLRLDDTRCTQVRSIPVPADDDEARKYVQQAVAAYPELYFARLVVLGEGASEEVFLPRLFSAAQTDVDAHSVAVVPLGGRHVNHMWRLLNALGIPHVTLLDLDRCRFGGGWGRVRTAVANLKEFASRAEIQAQLADKNVADLPTWRETDLPAADLDGGWLKWLESADVFFSAPLDLDFLLLESYQGVYMTEQEAPEGDTSEDTSQQGETPPPVEHASLKPGAELAPGDSATAAAGEAPTDQGLARQVLGRKSLDPTGTYTPAQLALFARYRSLFQMGSKPAAHFVALSKLTDEQLLSGLPPVMQRLVVRASALLTVHGE